MRRVVFAAGVLALLASTLSDEKRAEVFNPASAKQILVESATRGKHARMHASNPPLLRV